MRRFLFSRLALATAMVLAGTLLFAFFSRKSSNAEAQLPETVSFNFHIRPILSDRCFKCHGPDEKKREAGLRLDTQEGAFAPLSDSSSAGGGSIHYAIVPHHPEQSTLIQRIYSTHPDSVMPSPDSHLSL